MSTTLPDNENPFFQGIGIIRGLVDFSEERSTVTVGQQQYALGYSPQYPSAFRLLKSQVETDGKKEQRLIVYPRVIHFPQRDRSHELTFQVVGFDVGQPREQALQLEDFEFYLRGLWQFIPACRTPCISVFRNFSDERLDYIKKGTPKQRLNFLKPSHIPILWRDAPVQPFRFNPKADKEDRGSPFFVQVKAKFLLARNVFGFDSLLALPVETPPKFLKVSKADKLAVRNSSSVVSKSG